MKKYICEKCGEEFDKWQQKANHVRWIHKKITYSEDGYKKQQERINKKYGKKIKKEVICPKCKNPFEVMVREMALDNHKTFCSRKCANSRTWTERQKKAHIKRLNDPEDDYGKKFLEYSGEISHNKRFSSKIERALAEKLGDENFNRHLVIKTDLINFDVDISSKDSNIWIESDGPYHFEKVHKNYDFEKTQMRDYIEEQEAIKRNKLLIRIDNRKYKLISEQVKLIHDRIKKWNGKCGEVIKLY